MNDDYLNRLLSAIPGGAHTYSRGFDQYPANAPSILDRGKDAYVYTPDGSEFLDYGMALRAVQLGYANDVVDVAAYKEIKKGNNLTKPSIVELESAERLISLIDSVDMVKFTKNGSTAVTAAVKLARAFTGKTLVAKCAQQPFFSYDDWFIASTPVTRGIPEGVSELVKSFNYNDINSLERLLEESPGKYACVVLEPASTDCPNGSQTDFECCELFPHAQINDQGQNFLQQVEALCKKHGVIFILDEMITGFRWDLGGAQRTYGVKPDLSTFGKAMANGFSVAAIGGRREIMELGGIQTEGQERVFLLSTTHGAEMAGLGAFKAVAEFMESNPVTEHLWMYGSKLKKLIGEAAKDFGLENYFKAQGPNCSPNFVTFDGEGKPSLAFRTLFSQEMIRNKVLMPWIALSYSHGEKELDRTNAAVRASLSVYNRALEDGVGKHLVGPPIKPVFRKFN